MLLHRALFWVFLVAAPAISAVSEREWTAVTIDEDLNRHLIDMSSVRSVSGGTKSAWLRYEYKSPPSHLPKLKAVEAYENFDCEGGRRQLVLVYAFLREGDRVVEDKVRPWRDVTPGSSSAMEFELVCSVGSTPPQ
ncbi:surface-adhesin E family protein [Tsuneonella aeria]|uniref:surface-adhesin E family protein n=1 Tax=Tsuneonella aeria TaxID=1837929 RepID=UPI003B21C14D